MPSEHRESASKEQRIQEILHAYLQAVDAGQAPSQDEVLRQHPDLADELRAFFADQGKLNALAQAMRSAGAASAASTSPRPVPTGSCSPASDGPRLAPWHAPSDQFPAPACGPSPASAHADANRSTHALPPVLPALAAARRTPLAHTQLMVSRVRESVRTVV